MYLQSVKFRVIILSSSCTFTQVKTPVMSANGVQVSEDVLSKIVKSIIQQIAFYEQAAVFPSVPKEQQGHYVIMAIELYCELVDYDIDLPDALVMVDAEKANSPIYNTTLPGSIIYNTTIYIGKSL